MDLRRLRAGEWIAALGGAALLASLFLAWYGSSGTPSGWQAMTVGDLLLAVIALFALSLLPVTATQRVPALPLAMDALVSLAGIVAVVLVVIRMVSPPGGAEGVAAGIWLALAASLAVAAGGWLAMRDERLSEPDRTTDLTGRPAPPPPEIEVLRAP